ncbi:unnamed protein product [Absidia cylindrospora]
MMIESATKRSRHSRSRSPVKRKDRLRRSRSRSPVKRKDRLRRSRSRSPVERKDKIRHSKEKRSRRSPSPVQSGGKLETGLSFTIDKKGDSTNLKYGPDNYAVPSYRRVGYGRVLGLLDTKKIDPSINRNGNYLEIIGRKKPSNSHDRGFNISNLPMKDRILIRPGKDDGQAFSDPTGFIDIPSMVGLDSIAPTDSEASLISSGVDYRSIAGSSSDKKDGSDQDIPQHGENTEDFIRQRTIQYNKELSEDPSNVENWLAFINFQDEISKGLDTDAKRKSKTAKNTLNDVKISIFNKALENNPTSVELWLAYLRCGAEIWDTLTLLKNWDKALEKVPDSIQLWSDYINMRQTNFSSFSFDDCVRVFEDCLHTLHQKTKRLQALDQHDAQSMEELEIVESLMVYVVLRLCLFMKQAGYQERAFASIQALVEFCLFPPLIYEMSPSITLSRMISDFSKFWDSEVPRFGEPDAKGWRSYYAKTQNEEEIEKMAPKHFEKDDELYEVDTILDWLQHEQAQQRNHVLPRRMNDKERISIDDDPFRVVLAEDIVNILFKVTTASARTSLNYSIFVFLGLPYTPPGVGTNTHFSTDTFTHNDLHLNGFWPSTAEQYHRISYVENVPMEAAQQNTQNPFDLPLSYPVNVEELFARRDYWFSCFGKRYLTEEEEIMFARNAFDQLLAIEKNDSHLAVCYLSFESSYGYKRGRKLAKKLLKDQRTNIKLWNAYAQMQKAHDKPEEARKVYQLALTAAKDFAGDDHLLTPLLYRMYAQLELEYGCRQESLNILMKMATNDSFDKSDTLATSDIVKVEKYFDDAQQSTYHHLMEMDNEVLTTVAYESLVCHALFRYLVNGVDAAEQVYQQAYDDLSSNKIEHGFISEKIRVSHVELLYHHAKRKDGEYQPRKLRQATMQGLTLFPNNTILLGLFIWNESKTWIYNRVQAFFTTNLESDPNVILWLVYIYVHLHRKQPYDVNLVQTLFEEAVRHPRTRASILLWKLYIQHEIRLGNTQKAQALLYRSVRECPWSKDLYLFGFQELGSTMSTKELLDLTSLMMEKDIRTRLMIDQEELFELD